MNIIIGIVRIILNIIYGIMKLFPKKDMVVIASRQSDSKTLDIEMLEEKIKEVSPTTKVVVLCKKIPKGIGGKIGYCFHVLKQMWFMARARAIVVDSYCISVSFLRQRKSTEIIQMWHALGAFKKFGKSIVGNGGEGRSEKVAKAMNMHGNYTKILTSGEICKGPFMEAFGYTEKSMVIGSLPRVDLLKSKSYAEAKKAEIHKVYGDIIGDRKVVVYAPTFRKGKSMASEIKALADSLDKGKYAFVLKKHPLMETPEMDGVIVDSQFTTLEMLFAADYVVCDYSAIVYEAALAEKPLFFYAYDLDDYTGNRDFYLDYEKDMPGFIGRTGEEIAGAIEGENYDLSRVKAFADEYVEVQEDCTKKLAEIILS